MHILMIIIIIITITIIIIIIMMLIRMSITNEHHCRAGVMLISDARSDAH